MNVIAFPFAGGNKFSYNYLKSFLNKEITFDVYEYPGRGNRILEETLDSIEEIIEDLYPKVLKSIENISKPYIVYGHSMGALIAFLICHKIRENNLTMPVKLVLSGKKAPTKKNEEKIWNYSSEKFWKKLISMGGIPFEIENEMTLKNFFEPILRADFKAIEEFSYETINQLNIPMEILFGNEEIENEEDFLDWEKETTSGVTFFKYIGNHFFIYDHAQDIANHFIRGFKEHK